MDELRLMYVTNPRDLEVNLNEIKRYLKVKEVDSSIRKVLDESFSCVYSEAVPKAVYTQVPIKVGKASVDFGFFKARSQDLADHLRGCDAAFVVAATLGIGVDRVVEKYIKILQTKALVCDAIASALIESFCNKLNKLLITKKEAVSRFSPGYGDFDISYQNIILEHLEASKKVGITLTESMMMIPSKSVTAIIGLKKW